MKGYDYTDASVEGGNQRREGAPVSLRPPRFAVIFATATRTSLCRPLHNSSSSFNRAAEVSSAARWVHLV